MDMCGHVCQMSEGTSGAQHLEFLWRWGLTGSPTGSVRIGGVKGDHMALQTAELAVAYWDTNSPNHHIMSRHV